MLLAIEAFIPLMFGVDTGGGCLGHSLVATLCLRLVEHPVGAVSGNACMWLPPRVVKKAPSDKDQKPHLVRADRQRSVGYNADTKT